MLYHTLRVPSSNLLIYPLSLVVFIHARFMSLLMSLTDFVCVHLLNLQVVIAESLKPASSLSNVRSTRPNACFLFV